MNKYLIVVVLCILGAALTKAGGDEEMKKAFMDAAAACQTEVGASQADMDDLVAKKPASSREGKCLRACVFQKLGLMDADGNLATATITEFSKKFIGDDPAKLKMAADSIADCATKGVPGDHCESAVAYKECIMAAAKANGIECGL